LAKKALKEKQTILEREVEESVTALKSGISDQDIIKATDSLMGKVLEQVRSEDIPTATGSVKGVRLKPPVSYGAFRHAQEKDQKGNMSKKTSQVGTGGAEKDIEIEKTAIDGKIKTANDEKTKVTGKLVEAQTA
jgi:phage-related tail fiber protein